MSTTTTRFEDDAQLEAWLASLELKNGAHDDPAKGLCVMEAVAYFRNQDHTDAPPCVCETIRDFMMSWNDGMRSDQEREILKPYILKVPGTKGSPELALARSFMVADWYARVFVPAWLRCANVAIEQADALSSLLECTDAESLHKTDDHLSAAESAAKSAAKSAAWSAAWSAAKDALEPTVLTLRESACLLLDRMIALTEEDLAQR
jgi:hypothetical protein